jgi:hypothetical protein
MELNYQPQRKVSDFIFEIKKNSDFLEAPVVTEAPVNSETVDKLPSSNLLATPAVRRMAKELQVKIKFEYSFEKIIFELDFIK